VKSPAPFDGVAKQEERNALVSPRQAATLTPKAKRVTLRDGRHSGLRVLIVSPGLKASTMAKDEWRALCPKCLKTIEEPQYPAKKFSTHLNGRALRHAAEDRGMDHFVIVGAGAPGLGLAGPP